MGHGVLVFENIYEYSLRNSAGTLVLYSSGKYHIHGRKMSLRC
jgi:hypothetical protein